MIMFKRHHSAHSTVWKFVSLQYSAQLIHKTETGLSLKVGNFKYRDFTICKTVHLEYIQRVATKPIDSF